MVYALHLKSVSGLLRHRYIALKTIAERIMEQFDGDQFGDFKGTLLGLLSAYNYELRILEAATRLMSGDAFQTLQNLYRRKAGSVSATAVQPEDAALANSRGQPGNGRTDDMHSTAASAVGFASSSVQTAS